MSENILSEMLLIQEPSVFKLYQEMMKLASYFIAPVFTIALLIEYFGEMDFGGVVRKLFLIVIFMGAFYEFHKTAVDLSLETASYTLKKVSPRNLFVKNLFKSKVTTVHQKNWNILERFGIPNLNDLVATTFFVLAKVFIWLLKLIYSTVYHLTYVFSGLTAILFFLGWTKDALKGTIQASLWCMFLPFVLVAILALVGNSIDETALAGGLVIAKVETIIWLFGVTLLLLLTPVITYGMVKGDGIHSFGAKMGTMVVSSGMKGVAVGAMMTRLPEKVSRYATKLGGMRESFSNKNSGEKSSQSLKFGGSEKVESRNQEKTNQSRSTSVHQRLEGERSQRDQISKQTNQSAPSVQVKEKNQRSSEVRQNSTRSANTIQNSPVNHSKQEMKSTNNKDSSQLVREKQRDFKTHQQEKAQTSLTKTERSRPHERRNQHGI